MQRRGDAARERHGRDRPAPVAAGESCKAASESLPWRVSTDRTSGMPCSGKSRMKWRTTRHGRCGPSRRRAGAPANGWPESGNGGSRAPKAAKRSVRSPDANSGWNKKTQATGIGSLAGNGGAIEKTVSGDGGLAAAMAARFGQDVLTQVEKLQGAGREAASELHHAKLTWTLHFDDRNEIAELTPCSGRSATMSIRPKSSRKYDHGVEIHT